MGMLEFCMAEKAALLATAGLDPGPAAAAISKTNLVDWNGQISAQTIDTDMLSNSANDENMR